MFDTPYLPFVLAITFLGCMTISFMAMLFVKIKKRESIKNRQLLQELLNEKENTMRSIAMELHDNINQVLHMLRLDMRILEEHTSDQYKPLATGIGERLDRLLFDTQNISHYLNPQYVQNIGFIPALQEAATWLNMTLRIHCTFDIEGERKSLPHQVELMAFRIAQETIQNVLKYAQADHLSIILTFKPKEFQMRLIDNGKGIERDALHKGSGIENLYQRANIVGGQLTIYSVPNGGTSVLLNVPNIVYVSEAQR